MALTAHQLEALFPVPQTAAFTPSLSRVLPLLHSSAPETAVVLALDVTWVCAHLSRRLSLQAWLFLPSECPSPVGRWLCAALLEAFRPDSGILAFVLTRLRGYPLVLQNWKDSFEGKGSF